MTKFTISILAFALILFVGCAASLENLNMPNKHSADNFSNSVDNDRMLLVLSAPSVHNKYYKPAFQKIVDFQISYAKSILGNDNVVVIVDKDTKPYYAKSLPKDVLITADVYDIWMRDFTTVNPLDPVQFRYTWASMSKKQSEETQNSFAEFADKYGIERKRSELVIDGGNIVDNYGGRYITTIRFAKDNKASIAEAKKLLGEALGAKEVAIVEPDEQVLAHSDGMVMWLDEKTLLVNDYSKERAFRESVLKELKTSFPSANIIEVPVEYGHNKPGEWEGFESACGVNLNSVLTFKSIYVPVFGMPHDKKALEIIRKNTEKKVIEIDATGVCPMGGSVRCLTWQLTGKNAEKLILAARKD
jgi:agmatine/peptidylarginine deiminase